LIAPYPDSPQQKTQTLKRFLAEAMNAGKLNYLSTVRIHEISPHGPSHDFMMEFVDEESVADQFEQGASYSVWLDLDAG
jgi:hypothetical protein